MEKGDQEIRSFCSCLITDELGEIRRNWKAGNSKPTTFTYNTVGLWNSLPQVDTEAQNLRIQEGPDIPVDNRISSVNDDKFWK